VLGDGRLGERKLLDIEATTHEIERPDSKFIAALSEGWPIVLSNLKSLLETGKVAMTTSPGHENQTAGDGPVVRARQLPSGR
jgi:hypothetical protein